MTASNIISPAALFFIPFIQTYVYRQGIQSNNYSYAAAVGFFNSIVNFTIVFFANRLSRKITDTSIW